MRLIVPAWMLAAVCVGLVFQDKVRADDARYSQPSGASQSLDPSDPLWPAGAPNLAPVRHAAPLVQKAPTATAQSSPPINQNQSSTRPDALWPAGAPNLAIYQDSAVQPAGQSLAPATAPKLAIYSPPADASGSITQPDKLWPAGAPNLTPINQDAPPVEKVSAADAPYYRPASQSQTQPRASESRSTVSNTSSQIFHPDILWPAGAPHLSRYSSPAQLTDELQQQDPLQQFAATAVQEVSPQDPNARQQVFSEYGVRPADEPPLPEPQPAAAASLASFENTAPAPAPTADEQLWLNLPLSLDADIYLDHGVFRAAMQQPLAPLQPLQPVQPPSITPYQPSIPGAFDTLGSTSIAALAAAVGGSPAQGVSANQAQSLASTDIGGLLQSANTVQSVNTTRRSPVALAPNVRGYEFGQIYAQANGAYWFPVREDLDSMLNKIDPGMIQDVIVIPGPYGLRYGPGLSFIDIITQDTPRYNDGPGSDYRANGDLHTNGGQLYGRLTADGGGDDYGYRISYGHRKGRDYVAGNDQSIPSSFDTGDVWAQFGYSPSKYSRVEWSFLRLDQANVEYAAQFFDVDTMGTFGTTLKYIDEDPSSPWTQFKLEGWWNRTQFTGSITPNKRDPNFPVITRVEYALDQEVGGVNIINGNTLGDNVSSGARAVTLYGDLDDQYLRTGIDYHFLGQGIQENYIIHSSAGSALPPVSTFETNQPKGQLADGGFFSEYCIPVADGWKLTLGGRADWVNTSADINQLRPDTNLPADELQQSNVLYSYYATNEFKFTEEWTLNAGYGYAQRPPTLTERFSDGVFLGLLQSGFTRVIGDPTLKPERDFQLDLGLSANYDNFHANVTGFYAWVIDYITFEGDAVINFLDAKLVNFTNIPLGTLTGFEASADFDWSPTLMPFCKAKYVQGTDQLLQAPLPAIPPLEGTVGLRWHDASRAQKWQVEVGERMVTRQSRPGAIILNGGPQIVEEATPGFCTTYLHTSYSWTKNLTFVAGVDNIFNRTYQEQLDLRLLGPNGFPAPATRVLSPGISPFFGFDWKF